MKEFPSVKVVGLIRHSVQRPPGLVSWLEISVVVPADTMRSEGFSDEVEQFTPDLNGGQIEEVPNIPDLCPR